jgi:hypothetical protein
MKQVPASDRREQFVFEADQHSQVDNYAEVEEEAGEVSMAGRGEVMMSKRPAMAG